MHRGLFVFSAAVLLAPHAIADEPDEAPPAEQAPAPPPPEEPVEVVVTGTRTAESIHRSTVRTRMVSRDEALKRGATNVGEALAGELGVQVNPGAYGYLGSPSAVQIQGFDLDRVLILEDGERVIGDTGGAIDLSAIPLTDVSRIEYVTGPTSALYGTNAIGGVVNIITGPPDAYGPSTRARIEGRSHRGVVLEANGAYRHEDDWLSLDGSFRRNDAISLRSDRPDTALPELRRHSLGVRGGSRLGRGVEVVAKGRWLRDHSDGLTSEDVPGLGRYLIDLPETTDRFAVQLIERLDLGKGSSLSLSGARQWVENESTRDRQNSPVDETRFRSQRLTSFETTATLADGPARTWVIGARFEQEALTQRLERVEVSGTSLIDRSLPEVPKTTLGSVAGYAQLGWKLGRNATILPGVRAEQHLRFGGVIAPRLAAAYRAGRQVTLRASVGRGFRTPNAKEFGFIFDHSAVGYTVVGNRDLQPESSWGANANVTVRPDRELTLRVGGYANWVSNLIDLDFSRQLPSGVQEYHYVNVGRARTFGAETDVVITPKSRVSFGARIRVPVRPKRFSRGATSEPPGAQCSSRHRMAVSGNLPRGRPLQGRLERVRGAGSHRTGLSHAGFAAFEAGFSGGRGLRGCSRRARYPSGSPSHWRSASHRGPYVLHRGATQFSGGGMRKLILILLSLSLFSCKNEASDDGKSNPGTGGTTNNDGGGGTDAGDLPGVDVTVTVPATGRVFVDSRCAGRRRATERRSGFPGVGHCVFRVGRVHQQRAVGTGHQQGLRSAGNLGVLLGYATGSPVSRRRQDRRRVPRLVRL